MARVSGGAAFEAKFARIGIAVNEAARLRVGFLENARYPDGKPVAMIAAIHNYGAPRANIPPRPFFDNMIKRRSKEWPAAIAGLLRANDYSARRALALAGDAIAGQLRQQIIDTNAPPLKPATVRRKGFAKPLVDTGHMLQSVDYEVRS